MARRRSRRQRLPQEAVQIDIENMSHEGRGIARKEGKTIFIDNALLGEEVRFRYSSQRKTYDEGYAEEILLPSPDRVEPPCAYAQICGGCSLQHMDSAAQLRFKQSVLAEQLEKFGGVTPEQWLEPLRGPTLGYRTKARLGARYVAPKETALIGFREKRSNFLADMQQCEVLVPEVGQHLLALRELLNGLAARERIPQIEMAADDNTVALIFRHMDPLSEADFQALVDFCRARDWHCYLQPKSEDSVHRVWPETGSERLYFDHPTYGLRMAFHPKDFTQVNMAINRAMVPLAIELLGLEKHHRVLDLFCGLGNFTLPLATQSAEAVGVEVSEAMVQRGYENARANGVENVAFHAWDLQQSVEGQAWAAEPFDRIVLDPPRSGALEMIPILPKFGAEKIVYVSCNPATLARDAGELKAHGYHLVKAGVMDMFPHTSHVESIALFERR